MLFSSFHRTTCPRGEGWGVLINKAKLKENKFNSNPLPAMGACRDPPSKLLIPRATIISLKTLPISSPSRWAVNHLPSEGQQLPLNRFPAEAVTVNRTGCFTQTPTAFCGILRCKNCRYRKTPSKTPLFCTNYFHWDVKNVRSFHSFSWTAITFAFEI